MLRKPINVHEGQRLLLPEVRFHFYITNVRASVLSARQVIREANDRCNQENLIEQAKNEVHALRMPCDTLLANDAYMVMACLAWNLEAWAAQLWPDKEVGAELRRIEFRRFIASVIEIPCQIVRTARGLVHRFVFQNLSPSSLVCTRSEMFRFQVPSSKRTRVGEFYPVVSYSCSRMRRWSW